MINKIQDSTRGEGQNFGSEVQSKLSEMKETCQEWQAKASDSARRAMDATDNYVRDNPWVVIGSVALGCLVLGFLLARNRD
jgi:ElaB/YqjD/DUF883 family membrane-anchored ribosome-binding protein